MNKKIALPTDGIKLAQHFGHCEKFAIIEVNDEKIIKSELVSPPDHEHGAYPRFIIELNVDVVIAGGLGQKAQDILASSDIEVLKGVEIDTPENLVNLYLKNELKTGQNLCDH